MISRIVLALIAWRILRRLIVVAILIALLAAAMHAVPDTQPRHVRHRQTTIQRLLAPVERDITRAIGVGRSG